jgi:peroxiredoxin
MGEPEMIAFIAVGSKLKNQIQEVAMAIQEGKAAPEFTLPDADEKPVALKDFRGRNVVVYFYPKDNTSG